MSDILNFDIIRNFRKVQLDIWPDVEKAYIQLKEAQKKVFPTSFFPLTVQFNPGRIKSTNADVRKESISKRQCFLCSKNRPSIQREVPLTDDLTLLLNPFPICNYHFTIPLNGHLPQQFKPAAMFNVAQLIPDLVIFFNGASAGASAPDHFHLQAVEKKDLPLIEFVDNNFKADINNKILKSSDFFPELPFLFYFGCLDIDSNDLVYNLEKLNLMKGGLERNDPGLINAYFWNVSNNKICFLIIPRKKHRPDCFFCEDEKKLLVSPGAIDMAGLVITPRKEDFDKITLQDILDIYSETALPNI